jgi:hypothetical protein
MITKKIKLLIPKEKEKLYNIILKDLNDFEIEFYEVDANGNCSLTIYAKTKSPKSPKEPIEPPAIKFPPIPTDTRCL